MSVRPRAFTLVEMLLAVALSALLMVAVLFVLSGVARNRRVLRQLKAGTDDRWLEQMRWDLVNARTLTQSEDGSVLSLVGHGSIDPQSMSANGRLVSITYRCQRIGQLNTLVREQQYMDDPSGSHAWRQLLACDVSQLSVLPQDADVFVGTFVVPSRVRIRAIQGSQSIDRNYQLK